MKQVLIYSIQPEHVLNFLNGRKTVEIRKRDLPQWAKETLERGEVVEGYGYCTKGGEPLYDGEKIYLGHGDYRETVRVLNGLVVFKFQVSGVSRFDYDKRINHYTYGNMQVDNMTKFLKNVCITENDIWNYGSNSGFKPLYAHHFTNIQPIEPMEIGEFKTLDISQFQDSSGNPSFDDYFELTKAPQSFQSAWVKEVVE